MHVLAPEVWQLEAGGQVVLFHELTGRSVSLSMASARELQGWSPELPPPPALVPIHRRLQQLSFLAEDGRPELSQLIPARSRLVLTLPAPSLWLPLPTVRTPSGHAFAERPLNEQELAIWQAINGARTTEAVAHLAEVAIERVLAFFQELTSPFVQALQLRRRPVGPQVLSLRRVVAPDRMPRGNTAAAPYQVYEITGVFAAYDPRESRISYCFAEPHAAFSGRSMPAALAAGLRDRGLLPETGPQVLVDVDAGFIQQWRTEAPPAELVRVSQDTRGTGEAGVRNMVGRATQLPLSSANLVVCCDVVADLEVVTIDADWNTDPVVAGFVERFDLQVAEGQLVNLGAWRLVEELGRVVQQGVAVVTGPGSMDQRVAVTEVRNQLAHTIDFGELAKIAAGLGFEVSFWPMPEFLDADLGATWLARHSFEALRARLVGQGEVLRARAWTPETLSLPWPVEGIEWVPLSEPGPGPLLTAQGVMILRR